MVGRIIHKTTEILGDITISTNAYSSESGDCVSITQAIYDRDILAHKNNVMLSTNDIDQILNKASGIKYGRKS